MPNKQKKIRVSFLATRSLIHHAHFSLILNAIPNLISLAIDNINHSFFSRLN